MAMDAGAPIIGGQFNIKDFGKNDPSWYDIPEPERRARMIAIRDKANAEAQAAAIGAS